MADRLTQLQDAVNQQADNFTNSLGILQQCANPSSFPSLSGANTPNSGGGTTTNPTANNSVPNNSNNANNPTKQPPSSTTNSTNEDHTHLFAQLVARTAKDIEVLIDSLPNEESSPELQNASLSKLDVENKEAGRKLEEVVLKGESLLSEIQSALHDIAQAQLEIQKLELR